MSYYYNPTENLSVDHLSGERGVTQKIKGAMQDAAKQFVYIGFLLWEVKQYEYFYEGNYGSVYDYAEAELGFKRSSTKNFIAICENFCKRDQNFKELPTMFLDERWSDYQYSQLTEMLSMSAVQRAKATPDMTVKQFRQLKKTTAHSYTTINEETGKLERIERPKETRGQTSGQKIPRQKEEPFMWYDARLETPKPYDRKLKLVVREYNPNNRQFSIGYYNTTDEQWYDQPGNKITVIYWMKLPYMPQ